MRPRLIDRFADWLAMPDAEIGGDAMIVFASVDPQCDVAPAKLMPWGKTSNVYAIATEYLRDLGRQLEDVAHVSPRWQAMIDRVQMGRAATAADEVMGTTGRRWTAGWRSTLRV